MGPAFQPDQTDSDTRIASQAARDSPRAVLFHRKTQHSFIPVHESIPVWQFLRPCIPETNTMLYISIVSEFLKFRQLKYALIIAFY